MTVRELIEQLRTFPNHLEVRIVTTQEDYGIGAVVRHLGQAVTLETDEAEDEGEYWRRAGLNHRGEA